MRTAANLAGAELQELVRAAVENNGGRITTVQITTPRDDGRFRQIGLNLQLFDRAFFNHDPDIIPKRNESGYSILVNGKPASRLEAEVLYIASFNRSDWLLRPRLIWNFQTDWRLVFGADIFHGPPEGFFGQFDNRDRVYTEVRYTF